MSKADRRINRTIHLAKHVVRIKRADGGETDPLLQPDVVAPARPEREWGPALTPEQAFSVPKVETSPSLVNRAFSTLTGGRNLENDIQQFRSRLPDVKEYGSALQHATDEARQMQNFGVQNMKSGEVGQSVLGAAQVPLGYFNQAIAPVTAGFDVLSQTAGKFDPRLKAEADVIGLLGTEGSSALSKTARAASDISNYVPAATLAVGAIPAKWKTTEGRVLSDTGLYSHGAETAAGLPQAKGTADQMISMLRNQGVRPEELAHAGLIDEAAIAQRQAEIKAAYEPKIQAAEQGLAGLAEGTPEYKAAKRLYDNTVSSMRAEMSNALVVHPDWAGKPVTREELAQHLQQSVPQVEETILGESRQRKQYENLTNQWERDSNELFNAGYSYLDDIDTIPQALHPLYNRINEIGKILDKLDQNPPQTKPKFQEYTIPGGENYRELLLKLPNAGDGGPETRWLPGSGIVPRQSPAFTSSHWDDPNVLAHVRMSDREGPNGEKLLHVEELQSDWGQQGREQGFAKKLDPKTLDKLNEEQASAMFNLENAREKFNNINEDIFRENIRKVYKNPLTEYDIPNALKSHEDVIKSTHPQKRFDEYKSNFLRMPDTYTPEQQALLQDALDRHIEARDAYNAAKDKLAEYKSSSSGIANAPYVTSTQGWTDLALKRVMKEAAEGGYDGIVFTPGAEQAKRYDLSKQVGKVYYDPDLQGGTLAAEGLNGQTILDKAGIKPENVAEYIGKEAAEKLLKQERDLNGHHVLEGNGLKIGGEGMKGYYDQIVPKRLQELVKQHDKEAKLGKSTIITSPQFHVLDRDGNFINSFKSIDEAERFIRKYNNGLGLPGGQVRKNASTKDKIESLHLPMTDKMRQSILSGQKAFNEGGRVGFADGGAPWNNDLSVTPFEYNPAQGSNVPLANLNLYQGYTPPAPQAPEALPEKKPDVTPADTAYYPDGSGGNSAYSGASAIGPSPSAAPAPSQSPAPAPDATPEATTGLGGWISGKVQSAVNNPLATMTNLGVGFVPGFGLLNTVSGLLGGPTVGTAISPNKAAPAAPEKTQASKISASDDVDVAQTAGNLGGFGTAGFNNGISDATGLSGGMGGGSEGMGSGPGGGGGGSGPGGSSGGGGGAGAGAGAGAGGLGGVGGSGGVSAGADRDGNDNSGNGVGAGTAGSAGGIGGRDSNNADSTGTTGGNAGGPGVGGDNEGATAGPGGNSEGVAGVKNGGAITLRRYRAEGGPIKITPAQASAGNYKKKHVNFQGLPVAIETQKGHIREKVVNGEVHWRVKMPSDYGYVKGTKDNDGDATDVFLGPNHKSGKVWLIDQADTKTGKFDEHKAMLGFDSKKQAVDTYIRSFSDGKGKKRVMNTTEMSVDQYKNWVKNGNLKKPVASSPLIHKALGVVSKKK